MSQSEPRKYVLVCERCGSKRGSVCPPWKHYAPRLCRSCNLDTARVGLAKMFRRPVLERDKLKGHK